MLIVLVHATVPFGESNLFACVLANRPRIRGGLGGRRGGLASPSAMRLDQLVYLGVHRFRSAGDAPSRANRNDGMRAGQEHGASRIAGLCDARTGVAIRVRIAVHGRQGERRADVEVGVGRGPVVDAAHIGRLLPVVRPVAHRGPIRHGERRVHEQEAEVWNVRVHEFAHGLVFGPLAGSISGLRLPIGTRRVRGRDGEGVVPIHTVTSREHDARGDDRARTDPPVIHGDENGFRIRRCYPRRVADRLDRRLGTVVRREWICIAGRSTAEQPEHDT